MKPLPLSGRASQCDGFNLTGERVVFRVRQGDDGLGDLTAHDVALDRGAADIERVRFADIETVCVVGDSRARPDGFAQLVRLPAQFDYLDAGDILGLHVPSRRFRVLYRRSSQHNSFLVTERCNHYCLMCSQPPRDIDDAWILEEIATTLPLINRRTASLGFTGGEPLLEWRRFISLLSDTRTLLPETEIHVLTNGRGFASPEIAAAWAGVNHTRLCAGIPIYSAIDHVHDYVVQARNAFDETVLGVLRLKDKGQRVEIRVVLHKITAPRIIETCTWLARNLPFVDHVALMGLENTGFALANQDVLWIDPVDYRRDLTIAANILASAGVPVSIYNLPLCLLDREVWAVSAQSISDWKNTYLPVCDGCSVRHQCAGFFSTGKMRESRGLHAIAHPGAHNA